jgi:2-phosphosulfolactate phosphatase
MGYRGTESADEDLLCAELIESDLLGRKFDYAERVRNIMNTTGKRFFMPENISFSPPTDFFLCTMVDRFDFVLKALKRNDGNIELLNVAD